MYLSFYKNQTEKQDTEVERQSACRGAGTTPGAQRTPELQMLFQVYKLWRQTCSAESQLAVRLMDIHEAPLPTAMR